MTFAELQLRVCERLGIADESGTASAVTSDVVLLDKVKRALNDAARELWRAVDPRTMQSVRWTFQSPYMTINLSNEPGPLTINGDVSRYRLPPTVISAPTGRVVWQEETGSGGGHVYDTSFETVVRKSAQEPDTRGVPIYCAVYPSPDAVVPVGSRQPMELRVFPKPSRNFRLLLKLKHEPATLVEDNQRGNWPAVHDLTIVAFAVRSLVGLGGLESAPSTQEAREQAVECLIASIAADYDMRPRTQGGFHPSGNGTWYATDELVTADGQRISFRV